MNLSGMRVGYAPYSLDLSAPGDRRRFPFYARRRDIPFEIAEPGGSYDLVVLSYRADITAWVDQPRSTRVVYELADSYLALPALDLRSVLRGPAKFLSRETRRPVLSYRRAIKAMCRRAEAVVCTTVEQRRMLLDLCPNVHVILDAHSELSGAIKSDYRAGQTLNIVWEGLPENVRFFRMIAPVLRRAAERRPVALHLVTDLRYAPYAGRFGYRDTRRVARRIFDPVVLYEWNPATAASIVTACDLAVIPLPLDDPFRSGKPENKLLLMWRLAMPTLVSATPAYRRVMDACGLQLTCSTTEDWYAELERLAHDEELRRHAGEVGRDFVEKNHDEEAILERWDTLFESVR